jgi:hypothetical protein
MPELYTALTQDKVIKEAALRSGVSKGVMQACEQSDHQSTRLAVVSVSICKQNKSICFQVDSWRQNEDLNWAPNIDWHRENAYLCSP